MRSPNQPNVIRFTFSVWLTCVIAGECVIPIECPLSCWCWWCGLCSPPRCAWLWRGGLTWRGGVDAAAILPRDRAPWWGTLVRGTVPLEDRAWSWGWIWVWGGGRWGPRPGLEAWEGCDGCGYGMYMLGCWWGGREWGWASELEEGCWPGWPG